MDPFMSVKKFVCKLNTEEIVKDTLTHLWIDMELEVCNQS